MVTRRNVLKIAIPAAAAIPAVALGASSTTGKNVFLSVSDLSTYTGGNGDIGFLVSYHEGKMTGGGTLIHTISSEKQT